MSLQWVKVVETFKLGINGNTTKSVTLPLSTNKVIFCYDVCASHTTIMQTSSYTNSSLNVRIKNFDAGNASTVSWYSVFAIGYN